MQNRNDSQIAMNDMFRSFVEMRKQPAAVAGMREERMPFRIKLVRSNDDLSKAVSIRHAAYARHVPQFAAGLTAPEPMDYEDGTVVLLAESRLDDSPIGTMRIRTNRNAPLALEQSVKLPEHLEFASLAEATRLGVAQGRMGTVVKTMLFKAFFQYCQQTAIEWIVIAARSPLDRQYEDMLFDDLFPEAGYIPMKHGGGIPHRVLALDVVNVQSIWAEAKHPLYNFIFETRHPDIDLGAAMTPLTLPAAKRAEPLDLSQIRVAGNA